MLYSKKYNFRLKVFLACSLFLLTLLIVLGTHLRFLKYRYFIAGAKGKDLRSNIEIIGGSFIDAVTVNINRFKSLFDNQRLSTHSKIKDIHLRVQRGSIQEMASNLPFSAKKKYYKADLLYPDGSWKPIKYRFRGRNIWHWQPNKPSLRLKLKKKNHLDMQRMINLVNPEDRTMTSNIIGEELARKLGVMTHLTDYARVFINGQYRGVYHQTTREDKNMILMNKRMLGPIFIGDNLSPKWLRKNFEDSGDTRILKKFDALNHLLAIMEMPLSVEKLSKLWNILSFDKYVGWHTTINLVGGIHTDYHHNHLYFYDPSLGKLEPIISDINGHGLLTKALGYDKLKRFLKLDFNHFAYFDIPLNEKLHPLSDLVFRDPRFVHQRNKLLYESIKGIGSLENQNKILDRYFSLIDHHVKADKNKESLVPLFFGFFRVPYSNGQYEQAKKNVREWIKNRNDFIEEKFKKSVIKIKVKEDVDGFIIKVSVSGYPTVVFDVDNFKNKISRVDSFKNKRDPLVSGKILLYPGLRKDFEFDYRSTRSRRVPEYYLFPDFQHYPFQIKATNKEQLMKLLKDSFSNSLSTQKINPEIVFDDSIDFKNIEYNKNSIHPWLFNDSKRQKSIILGPGKVVLEKTLLVEEDQSLIIKPDTLILMHKKVSIASKGKTLIQGTKDKPVTIKRFNEDEPWGVFVIQGKKANNSQISHAFFAGGSKDQIFNVFYSGMVSIHNSENVTITNSVFSSNILSDDTLHVVYSDNFELKDSRFVNCFSDALDFDYSKGIIENLVIEKPGNDGLDFMTSDFLVDNVLIKDANDKGISCGEKTSLTVKNSSIQNSNIGIAVKDGSMVNVLNTSLIKNFKAVDVFMKKQLFEFPGKIFLQDVKLDQNQLDLQVEENGQIFILRSPFKTNFGDGKITLK